jgi:flagellar motor component MotA
MKAERNAAEDQSPDHLWAEALWGLGLIGTVFGLVLALVTVFGR